MWFECINSQDDVGLLIWALRGRFGTMHQRENSKSSRHGVTETPGMKGGFLSALIIPIISSRLRCILPSLLRLPALGASNWSWLQEVQLDAISDTLSSETAPSLSGWETAGWNHVRVSSKRRHNQTGALNLRARRWRVPRPQPHCNVMLPEDV